MHGNPCTDRGQDASRFGGALLCNRVGNRDARVIGEIPRSSVGIQDANPLGGNAGCLWQSLNQELTVARFTLSAA
jgi:hypothetical protein